MTFGQMPGQASRIRRIGPDQLAQQKSQTQRTFTIPGSSQTYTSYSPGAMAGRRPVTGANAQRAYDQNRSAMQQYRSSVPGTAGAASGSGNGIQVNIPTGNPISPEQEAQARDEVTDVRATLPSMQANLPWMQNMTRGEQAEMARNSQDMRNMAQDANRQKLNYFMGTEPIEGMLQREILGGQVGVDQANILARMQGLKDDYGLANDYRKTLIAQSLLR